MSRRSKEYLKEVYYAIGETLREIDLAKLSEGSTSLTLGEYERLVAERNDLKDELFHLYDIRVGQTKTLSRELKTIMGVLPKGDKVVVRDIEEHESSFSHKIWIKVESLSNGLEVANCAVTDFEEEETVENALVEFLINERDSMGTFPFGTVESLVTSGYKAFPRFREAREASTEMEQAKALKRFAEYIISDIEGEWSE